MKSVLIAEDNHDLRTIFYKAFDNTDFDIRTAIDGQDAINQIEQSLPDIIILDIDMPKITGLGVIDYIKNTNRDITIILVTGNALATDAPQAQYVDLVLVKPVSIRELLTFVNRFATR